MLSSADAPVRRVSSSGRIVPAALAGGIVAFVVLVQWLGLQPLGAAARTASFWMKIGYTGALAIGGMLIAARLGRPGGAAGGPVRLVLAVVGVMAAVAVLQLAGTPKRLWLEAWLGDTWRQCPARIVLLAIPVFLGVVLALRRLAPTRLAAAGAAAGLVAGAVGATVYGLYCQETTAAFTAAWYTLGVAMSALLGGLAGPRLLRW